MKSIFVCLLLGTALFCSSADAQKPATQINAASKAPPNSVPSAKTKDVIALSQTTPSVTTKNASPVLHELQVDESKTIKSIDETHWWQSADWWLAIFTGLLLVVAISQVFLFFWQLKLIREQSNDASQTANAARLSAEAARESVELSRQVSKAELRAYLGVDEDTRPEITQLLEDNVLTLHAVIKNSGKTPAYKVKRALKVYCLDCPLPNDFQFPDPTATALGTEMLNPGEQTFHLFDYGIAAMPADIRAQVFDPVGGNKRIFVLGHVVYEDAFGERHHTNFCVCILWKNGHKKKPAWVLYRHGNDAT